MTVDYWASGAWVGGRTVADVRIVTEGGTIRRVEEGVPCGDATRLEGWAVPGMVSAHSHTFQRALRGRVNTTGDFWSWRRTMYALAEKLDPDSLQGLATAAYSEMLAAGITLVGEFHYLHHGPGGRRYQDENEMAMALVRAAETVGIRLCLLDSCYLRTGFDGGPLDGAQRRFSDGDTDGWAARHHELGRRLSGHPLVTVGAAIHSVRAVSPPAIGEVAAEAGTAPLHVHVSEQPAENEACLSATGSTPVGLLFENGALSGSTVAVHATHIDDEDRALLASAGTAVCLCPSTELDLGDGTAASYRLAEANVPISLGSDSHAVVDLLWEARGVEWNDRARTGRRGVHTPESLWTMATGAGAAALGRQAWGLVEGAPADFCVISPHTARTAGVGSIESALFAAGPADVETTVVAGEVLVEGDEHARLGAVGPMLAREIERTSNP